jgi:hypothetical protein
MPQYYYGTLDGENRNEYTVYAEKAPGKWLLGRMEMTG